MLRTAWAGLVILAIAACVLLASRAVRADVAPGPILGYAWSDNVGWINCANTNSCNSICLTMAVDGTVTGYAWSDNIGWVSANTEDLVGCPSSPCSARLSSSDFSGWLKALSVSDQSGGWDGFP